MSAKINSAESIRGLACLAVVFSHLAMSFFPYLHHFDPHETTDLKWVYHVHHSPFGFFYSGDAAVFVFFVLSGYVLSYAILKSPQQFHSKIKNMMIKRYPRLMIPALASCLLIWSVFKIIHIDSQHVGAWLQAFAVQNYSFSHALYEGMPLYEDGPGSGDWNFNRYRLPRGKDVAVWNQTANILPVTEQEDHPKGIAEVVQIPTIPAVANAVAHAVGKYLRELPLTEEKIKEALS